MPYVENIGAACAEYRKRKGFTQLHVAIDTGYTPETISQFEHGHNNKAVILMWYFCNCVNAYSFYDFLEKCLRYETK